MAKPKVKSSPASSRRLRREFNLGGEQAEADGLLSDAFYESGIYSVIASKIDKKCFLVGRTGSGKSAALQRIEDNYPDHVIRISPEDLSLPYITDLGVVRYLSQLGIHMDPLFIALWKHVLLIEIIKQRYSVDSPEAKQRFFAMLMDKVKRDRSKQAALEYLEEFEGKFWCETDERVRDITRKFEDQVKAEGGGKLKAAIGEFNVGGSESFSSSVEDRAEQVQRFQRIVNDTQLPRLNKMIGVLDDDILDSSQHYTYIVIDDLDRDWVDEKIANDLIRCLFRAVNDLKRVDNLKILVALRTNIFEALDFGRTGGQEEKFRALTLRMRWNKVELTELLDERVRVAASRLGIEGVSRLSELLPSTNKVRGNPIDYILHRTLMRPRDAITFLNECFELASGKERLSWEDIHAAEGAYSNSRLLALRDEWKPTYPGIDQALRIFTGAPALMDLDELTKRLDDCILLASDHKFPGLQWLTELSSTFWDGEGASDWAEIYHPLIRMLFNIGFIGYSKGPGHKPVYAYDDPDFADRLGNIREVRAFLVHPAFRPALEIRPGSRGEEG
jgi:hypothetical protein